MIKSIHAHLLSRGLIPIFLMAAFLSVPAPVFAQQIKPLDVYQDPHGIDLVSNNVSTSKMPTLSIPAAPELTFRDLADFIPVIEVVIGTPQPGTDPEIYTVNAGTIASDGFISCSIQFCTSAKGNGSKLLLHGVEDNSRPGTGGYTYIQGGTGKRIHFLRETENPSGQLPPSVRKFLAFEVNNPGGRDISISYDTANISGITRHRPNKVMSTSGYELRFTYATNDATLSWGSLQRAEIVATANPLVVLASHVYAGNTVTDIAGRVFHCVCAPDIYQEQPAARGSRMKLPGESVWAFETTRPQFTHTRTVTSDGATYTYVSVPDQHWPHITDYSSGDRTWKGTLDKITITGPEGFSQIVEITNELGPGGIDGEPRRRIDSITDSQGRVTSYEYASGVMLNKITYPEGNAVEVDYNPHGNITVRRQVAKPGSGQANLVEEAGYTITGPCTSDFSCYNPAWTKDAKGNQTDYTWDASHGGMLTQLDPVNGNGQRRKVINTWSGTAPINGETCGAMMSSGFPIGQRCVPRLLREEVCATNASGGNLTCGTANSFVRTWTYFGATSLPLTETITDGAGNSPLTTTYSYDNAGRVLSVDGPLAGTDDAVYYKYDTVGRRTMEIGPKGEAGYRQATKTTYRDADDQPTKIERGRVSDAAGNGWVLFSQVETQYNSRRLATQSKVVASGTTHSLTQTSYDARNRVECTAVRMNPAIYGSLPSSACTLGTAGSHGPDRIVKNTYDTEGRVTKIQQGYGTSVQRDYTTYTFTPNGQTASMTDARGYKASMAYDGFDRQTRWYFPSKTATGAVNPNDYEAYAYDANGNRTSLRKRDGSTISYTYDNLNRVTKKTVPARAGLSSLHTRDVFYKYDIRGLQTDARFLSDTGLGVAYTYDRYGRALTEMQSSDGTTRIATSQYDANGNRTRLTHPDGQYFDYEYDGANRLKMVRDTNAVWLSGLTYNANGTLASIDYPPGGTINARGFYYDNVQRLNGLINDIGASTTNDVTWNYTRNPASQIITESQTNDAYSWNGHVNVTRNYATNGLNQYTSAGGASFTYDANGNLTSDGTNSYTYDVENRLVRVASGGYSTDMYYDPLGRLYNIISTKPGHGQTIFLYDGNALIAEYAANGTMLRRFVHGSNVEADDPLAWYEGAGISSAARRFLYADARGSISAVADESGNAIAINTYDEYGIPAASNQGRFQYTGQVWLPEIGLYYYKARFYSPTLGRFLQTDPIGYEDNVNLYAYVANDPINGVDPSGLKEKKPRRQEDPPLGSRIRRNKGEKNGGFDATLGANGNSSAGDGGDGHLTFDEANAYFRNGEGQDLTLDATKLTVIPENRDAERTNASVVGADWFVHGTVFMSRQSDGSYRIESELYDFDIKPWNSLRNVGRNLATYIGRAKAGEGRPFMIHFRGAPRIQPIPSPPQCLSCP